MATAVDTLHVVCPLVAALACQDVSASAPQVRPRVRLHYIAEDEAHVRKDWQELLNTVHKYILYWVFGILHLSRSREFGLQPGIGGRARATDETCTTVDMRSRRWWARPAAALLAFVMLTW